MRNKIIELMTTHSVSEEFKIALLTIVDSNKSVKRVAHPSEEIDGVMHHWCRYHQTMEAEPKMVMSKGKSKGYCRAAISKWNKASATIKKDTAMVLDLMDTDMEAAMALKKTVATLKATFNDPSFYDLEADWEAFNKTVRTATGSKSPRLSLTEKVFGTEEKKQERLEKMKQEQLEKMKQANEIAKAKSEVLEIMAVEVDEEAIEAKKKEEALQREARIAKRKELSALIATEDDDTKMVDIEL